MAKPLDLADHALGHGDALHGQVDADHDQTNGDDLGVERADADRIQNVIETSGVRCRTGQGQASSDASAHSIHIQLFLEINTKQKLT